MITTTIDAITEQRDGSFVQQSSLGAGQQTLARLSAQQSAQELSAQQQR